MLSFRLNPGQHRLRVSAPGYQTQERELPLAERERRTLSLVLDAADSRRFGTIATVSFGAALVVGAYGRCELLFVAPPASGAATAARPHLQPLVTPRAAGATLGARRNVLSRGTITAAWLRRVNERARLGLDRVRPAWLL